MTSPNVDVVHPLDPTQHRVQNAVVLDPGVQFGLALLDLADDHIDGVVLQLEHRVVDQQHCVVGRLARITDVDVAGKTDTHDVDVGYRLEAPALVPSLHLEFAQRHVASESQVVLNEVDRYIHMLILQTFPSIQAESACDSEDRLRA